MSSPFSSRPNPVHISALITPALLAAAVPTFAQQSGGDADWGIGPSISFVHFSAAGSDGIGAEAGFARSVGTGVGVERSIGPLALLLAIEHLTTRIQVRDDVVLIEPQEPAVDRTRLGLSIRKVLIRGDGARLTLDAGPTLDIWSPDGSDSRSSAGAAARLALETHAGPVAIENALGFGVSKGPLDAGDLPEGYERSTMRTITITIGARFGL